MGRIARAQRPYMLLTRRASVLRQSFLLSADNLGRRVASGAGFKFLGIILRTVFTIGSTAVLARLLLPADFGYIAMASVITEFAGLFASFGFTNVLIQRHRITRLQTETIFWATLGLGALLTVAIYLASFMAHRLFDDAQVVPVLQLLSLNFLITSLTSVPHVAMARLMRFRAEFWIQILGAAVRAAVAIGCAWAGWGVLSLAAGGVAGSLAVMVAGFIYVPFLPRWRFHMPFITSTWRASSSYFGSGILYYAYMNLDLLLIGRYIGATGLGYYQNARSLTDEIRARIAMPIQQVLFPALSSIQTDLPRAQALVMRSSRLLAAVVVPIGIGVSANADELVRVLYGERWHPMIPVLSMFGIATALRSSTAAASPLFNAANRPDLALGYNLVGTVLLVVSLMLAMPYGMHAVGAAMAVSSLYSLVTCHRGLQLIGLGWREVFTTVTAPFAAAGLMWLATFVLRPYTQQWLGHPGPVLLAHVLMGALLYLLALPLLSRYYVHELRLALQMLRARGAHA